MTGFAALQEKFQRAILEGDDAVLAELLDGAREQRGPLFEVYRNAYGLRLVEVIGKEHELLRTYVGDAMFGEMASAYIAAHPSRFANARWVSHAFPAFLAETEPYADYPILTELAGLEKALNDAFDAPDGTVLTGTTLAEVPPEVWQSLVVEPHPSARRLTHTTNAGALWSALRADEPVPEVETSPEPAALLVWRQDGTPMWRALGPEEAMMWDEAAAGVPFGQLCMMLATFDDPDTAPGRAAGYLGAWVGAGLLAATRLAEDVPAERPASRRM